MLTPQTLVPKLAEAIGLNADLYLKREDQHPLGSQKGRSIPTMIDTHLKQGWTDFVISSSGNAALAAALYVNDHNQNNPDKKITLGIMVGRKIDQAKLKKLRHTVKGRHIFVEQVDRPKQTAFQTDKNKQAKILRQSTDDTALLGYADLAKELAEIENLSAVFVPTSSGTTAQGLVVGFEKLNLKPEIHIVQTDTCHPMVEGNSSITDASLANAIVDKIAHRKQAVVAAVKSSGGQGWVANNGQIKAVIELVKKTEKINLSGNSALSIVGLQQALKQNRAFSGPVVCLITGQ